MQQIDGGMQATQNQQPATRTHILITETSPEEGQYLIHALEQLVGPLQIMQEQSKLADTAPEELAQTEILIPFIHSQVGKAEMEAMPKLRLIATRSTGYDHIDLAYATQHGIAVANVPGYGENAVAEHTFALILMLSRKIHLAYTRSLQRNYTIEGLRGFDLYGKTLGVVGTGAIGLHVIRIARGFGMHVLASDVRENRQLAEILGFSYVPLDELLAQSHIVTLHAPALPSTYHLIRRETLLKMKQGALLINTARGSLVDVHALAWALDNKMLAGAGLDALEGEEFLQNEEELLKAPGTEEKLKLLVQHHILQRHSNVIITPHIAFNSEEALQRILDTTVENVRAFLLDKPQNLVTVQR